VPVADLPSWEGKERAREVGTHCRSMPSRAAARPGSNQYATRPWPPGSTPGADLLGQVGMPAVLPVQPAERSGPPGQVPSEYIDKLALDVGGSVVVLERTDNLPEAMASVLSRSRWVSPPLLQKLSRHPSARMRTAVVGCPGCPPKIAGEIIKDVRRFGGDNQFGICMAAADNQALPVELRRTALRAVLGSNDVLAVNMAAAFLHPDCTTEMRLAVRAAVLVANAGYLFNGDQEFWRALPTVLSQGQLEVVLRGPACPRYIRAMWQLAGRS